MDNGVEIKRTKDEFIIEINDLDEFKGVISAIEKAQRSNSQKVIIDISSLKSIKSDNIRYLAIASKKFLDRMVVFVNEDVYHFLSAMKLNSMIRMIKK